MFFLLKKKYKGEKTERGVCKVPEKRLGLGWIPLEVRKEEKKQKTRRRDIGEGGGVKRDKIGWYRNSRLGETAAN